MLMKVLEAGGIKMAHFHHGDYDGVRYCAFPKRFRYFRPLWSIPYFIGTKPEFYIKIKATKEVTLNRLPIKEKVGDEKARPIPMIQQLPDDQDTVLIPGYYIPTKGAVEYWIGEPNGSHSKKLADFPGIWRDQIWLIVFSGSVGFIIGLFGQWLMNH